MLLSILICHLTSRKEKLERLIGCLEKQANVQMAMIYICPPHPPGKPRVVSQDGTDAIELIIAADEGQMSIGAKRNFLLECAAGDYICFFDDDDLPNDQYLSKILKALESKPDCVGFEGQLIRTGGPTSRFIHSIKYDHWYEENSVYLRSPNHLNPVRRELALKVKFPEVSHGEDAEYSKQIFPLLKSEVFLDGGPIYQYLK